jgi:hypothetical protein
MGRRLLAVRVRVLLLMMMLVSFIAHASPSPPDHCSRNGRFCALLRYVDVRDGSMVILQITDNGVPIRTVDVPCDPLLTDDGHYVVCAPSWRGSALQVIRLADGAIVASTPIEELLTANDLVSFSTAPAPWTLLEEAGSPARLVLPMPASVTRAITVDVVVDVATGELITPKRDIYPLPGVEVRAAGPVKVWHEPRCSGRLLPFEGSGLVSIDAQALRENAVITPMPEYPLIARKAHV